MSNIHIRNEIISAQLYGSTNEISIDGLFQYDHGLKQKLLGIQTNSDVDAHFAYDGISKAIVVQTQPDGDGYLCDIPDVVLTQPKEVTCYVYAENKDTGMTIKVIHFPMMQREKPSEYRTVPKLGRQSYATFDVQNGFLYMFQDEKNDAISFFLNDNGEQLFEIKNTK